MISEKDEHLHVPQKVPLWRESYYFNVMDPKNNIFSVSTMGYMPTEMESHYFSIVYVDGKLYTHINFPKLKSQTDLRENPSDGAQSFTILKENHEWKIEIKERNFQLEYLWQGRFPVYEYPGGWRIPGVLEQAHYEQSGIVNGTFVFKDGRKKEIQGLGHRDHSWGLRNWVQIDEWYWISVQFENGNTALNGWLNVVQGKKYTHGFISTAQGNLTITQIEVEPRYEGQSSQNPQGALFKLTDQRGEECLLNAETIYVMKLPQSSKEGVAYIYETISKFKMDGELGYGVAEYLKSERSSQIGENI